MESLQWEEYERNPLIQPPFPSPVIADPTFFHPGDTPDGKWHLFAHSLMGIHHFFSPDGIAWTRLRGIISWRSMRPFLFKEENIYHLFYEKILRYFPYHSRIEARKSQDLFRWSVPRTVLTPSLPWHKDGSPQGAVGNPCLVKTEEGYRLYYSAGLVYLKDCRFCEPKFIGIAAARDITEECQPESQPILSPSENDPYGNMGAGSIKVLKTDDGYAGFQNGIYWDGEKNHSGSAVRILLSSNGRQWNAGKPLLKPDRGWKKSHVYALDVKKTGEKFYLYFNARSGWLFGKERIGLLFGKSYGEDLQPS